MRKRSISPALADRSARQSLARPALHLDECPRDRWDVCTSGARWMYKRSKIARRAWSVGRQAGRIRVISAVRIRAQFEWQTMELKPWKWPSDDDVKDQGSSRAIDIAFLEEVLAASGHWHTRAFRLIWLSKWFRSNHSGSSCEYIYTTTLQVLLPREIKKYTFVVYNIR